MNTSRKQTVHQIPKVLPLPLLLLLLLLLLLSLLSLPICSFPVTGGSEAVREYAVRLVRASTTLKNEKFDHREEESHTDTEMKREREMKRDEER